MQPSTQYNIFVVSPPGYQHNQAFQEVAEGFREGFAELGEVVPVVYDHSQIKGRALVLGANLLPLYPDIQLPPNCIILNLEQAATGWFSKEYLDLLRCHEVWDYSDANIYALKVHGIEAKFCGIGYEPCLTRIPPTEEDIDVLFYGSIFGRRLPILEAIEATGLKVKRLFGVYGVERDHWIGRSKIVLNIHAYEGAPLEVVRLSYLWANRKFVISEFGDTAIHLVGRAAIYAAPEEMPELCLQYAQDPAGCRTVAERGFQQFAGTRQSEYLKRLL